MMRRESALPLAAMMLAFWPVWIWFAKGIVDRSNDYSGLLAGATVIAVLVRARPAGAVSSPLALPAAAVSLYLAAVMCEVSPGIAAVIAALGLAAFASAWRMGRRCDLALAALCVLALPLAASLQFYLGYPLRVLAGCLTAAMLNMNGITAVREGASLLWDGRVIAIDAPCSGVRMLWTGIYLSCALAALSGMKSRHTLVAVAAATAIVVLANAVRAAALFYTESGILHLPPWAHETVGMFCFVAAALAIAWSTQRIKVAP